MSNPRLPRSSVLLREEEAHKEWLKRGRSGPGRIHFEGKRFVQPQLGAWVLTASRWVGCEFHQGYAVSTHFEEAELRGCVWFGPNLLMAKLEEAQLIETTLHDAKMALTKGRGVCIQQSALVGAEIEKARWPGAVLRGVDFQGARMNGIDLQDSIIEDCSFRDADLSDSKLTGTRLVRCDLRGATLPDDVACTECTR